MTFARGKVIHSLPEAVPDDAVHDLTGSALDGWAWDGATLTDQNGDPVPLAGEEA